MVLDSAKVSIMLARKCITIADLADKMGIAASRAGVIVRGASISPKTAGRVARALECDVTDILAEDPDGEEV